LGAAFTRHPNVAIFWISVALGGLTFSAPIGWSIPALIAPEGSVGTLGGIFNCISGLCSLPAPIITGYIVQTTGSFASAFIAGGIVLVVGIFCYVVLYILFPSENDMLIVLCNVLASQLSDSKISSLS
jgi:MFS-type transporter involved in bile tolerance (Atg22 family)